MIRSTTVSLKFCNTGKARQIKQLIDEYQRVVGIFVDILWEEELVPGFLPKELTNAVETWLSARVKQCAGKQASGIVRGTRSKQEKRHYVVKKLEEQGEFKKARRLQAVIDKTKMAKPKIQAICPELDSRFVSFDLENNTTFDGWICLSSIGNKTKINIPFKRTKHFNKLFNKGVLKPGVRLGKKEIALMFDIPDVEKKTSGAVLGVDIGQTTVVACSNGVVSTKDKHGHDLSSITTKLCRCKKGSRGFQRAVAHRKNHINWAINQLNLTEVKEVRLENIKNMRRGKRANRRLSHWVYADIFSKLDRKCLEQGVLVTRISPTYTSKRCSSCGWTRHNNRKGRLFKCGECGFVADSDLNAAKNIAASLEPIGYKERQSHDIKTGFYWHERGDELVVHLVQRPIELRKDIFQ